MDFKAAQAPGYKFFMDRFKGWCKAEDIKDILEQEIPDDDGVARHMVDVKPGFYDQKAAALLAAAATWAYSDADTMARMMRLRGIPNNKTVSMRLKNDALFLESAAHVVESASGDMVILCFGGTQPTNLIQLMLDASVKPDPFFSSGHVHGGFFRAFLALWALPKIMLRARESFASLSVCDVLEMDAIGHRCETIVGSHVEIAKATEAKMPEASSGSSTCPTVIDRKPMEALYIAGHSLGAAFAVLAAAAICTDPKLEGLRQKLRGVYTYGQPMVGDSVFAETFDPWFGDRLFRHVYKDDLVPHLPPETAGKYVHFGHEYRVSRAERRILEGVLGPAYGPGWELRGKGGTRHQVKYGLIALASGALGWVADQFPLLDLLPLPYSLGDHSPLVYLRTSMQSAPGAEFLP